MQVLVVMTAAPGREVADFSPYQHAEEIQVWSMYREGALRQMWFRADERLGAVAMMEVQDIREAKSLVEALPMLRAGLLTPDFIPLGPFTGLEQLFSEENR